MRNFLKLTAMSLQSQMYYRTSFFLNLLSPMVLLAGQYLLWHALYQQQPDQRYGRRPDVLLPAHCLYPEPYHGLVL